MQSNHLFMSMGAAGLTLGLVLAATTPTRPHPIIGADWHAHVPYHPQPAVQVSRDVAGEYVGFDYVNMGPDLSAGLQQRADMLRAARLAAASYQPPRAEAPAVPDDVMEIDGPPGHGASRHIAPRYAEQPDDGGLTEVDGGDGPPDADGPPEADGPDSGE